MCVDRWTKFTLIQIFLYEGNALFMKNSDLRSWTFILEKEMFLYTIVGLVK